MIEQTQLDCGPALDAWLGAQREPLEQFLAELVALDSQIPPYSNEQNIAEFLRGRLRELGLGEAETLAFEPERPNLILRIPGEGGGPTLMLNGHVDTKPVGDARSEWRTDPLVPKVTDGRMFGLGVCDMKSAVAAMVYAAAALRATGTRLSGDLVLALTADEEAGSTLGARFVSGQLRDIDACLIGEPSGWEHDWQGIHLVSRGVCCFRLRVHGTQMHSSLSDLMPSINASRRMAGLMSAIGDELLLEFVPHPLGGAEPTLNVGVLVSGGVFFGVVPGQAEFACDLRTLPGMTEDQVRADLERWLDHRRALDPELDVELVFEPGLSWIPPAEIEPDHPLVGAVQAAAAEVLDVSPPLSVFPGGTDAPWFARAGIPTIPSFGPGLLTCCHGPNEYVDLDRVHEAARMYARAAARFCGTSITQR